MTRTQKVFGVFALLMAGIWGCAASESSSSATAKKLEARVAKLEEDLKTTSVSRDALKSRLVALEDQVRAESERTRLVEKERDEVAAKLNAKSMEKETAVADYDDLVKKLEGVLGQAKVAQSKVREIQVPVIATSRVKE
ncbi:hypothetical protein BH11PLA2_BH11PLA2_11550 [soil metagenome]